MDLKEIIATILSKQAIKTIGNKSDKAYANLLNGERRTTALRLELNEGASYGQIAQAYKAYAEDRLDFFITGHTGGDERFGTKLAEPLEAMHQQMTILTDNLAKTPEDIQAASAAESYLGGLVKYYNDSMDWAERSNNPNQVNSVLKHTKELFNLVEIYTSLHNKLNGASYPISFDDFYQKRLAAP